MHPYLVTRHEMPDAPDAAFSRADVEMADVEMADAYHQPARPDPPPLGFHYTARAVAMETPFMILLHHLRAAVERRDARQIEFQLRRILALTFLVPDADRAATAWPNVDLPLRALRGDAPGPYEFACASPDGRHLVRVRLPAAHRAQPGGGYAHLLAAPHERAAGAYGANAPPAITIQYVGSLRFQQYDNARHRLRQLRPPAVANS
jgi:hypothetical protein